MESVSFHLFSIGIIVRETNSARGCQGPNRQVNKRPQPCKYHPSAISVSLSFFSHFLYNHKKDTEVDKWRHFEAKRVGCRGQIELVSVEDRLETVRGVGAYVSLVGVLRRLVQKVVLLDQLLELRKSAKILRVGVSYDMSNIYISICLFF